MTLLLAVLTACRQEVTYQAPEFPEQHEVTVETLNDQYLFRYANQPACYDSLLIVGDMNDEAYICIFNRHSGNLITAFGRKGNGPGELITPVGYSVDPQKGYLYVNDYGRSSIFRYDLNHWEEGRPAYQEIKLNGELGERNRILHVKDSLFIARGMFYRLILATPEQTVQKCSPPTPDAHKFKTDKDWYSFTENACEAVSPSGSLYVSATSYGGIMEIYNLEGPSIGNPTYRYFYEPQMRQEGYVYTPTSETVFGFCHLSVTDRFIYATAHGRKNPTAMPTTIWKFSLTGEPIAAYHCGDTSIESFTVDENEQQIYAVAYKDGEQILSRIPMNEH